MNYRIIISIMALLLSFSAFSGPARRDPVYLLQPDGSTFLARIKGDEFMKIITTEAGNAIIQDEEGWWCYASYDDDGRKTSSGHKVGHDTPPAIITRSFNIPYKKLSAKALDKRRTAASMSPKAGGTDTEGQQKKRHGLVILAQFKDVKFTYTREDFVKLLTQSGYSVNGATGCAKEYFDAQFNGAVEFSFDVSNIVTLTNNVSYYGENDGDDNDKAPEKMVIDACKLVDNDIDFSLYDDDKDNIVDNVFIFFAGGDEAEGAGDNRIWSHAWYIYSGAQENLILDGKRIDSYACTAELSNRNGRNVMASIGTFCHEYAHTFNLPDMYDSDYSLSGGESDALWGSTSLMDYGNQNNYGNTPPNFNAIEREILGILEPEVINSDGGYTLQPIHESRKCYRLDTDNPDEYYLLECRAEEGWDKYAGGQGMLIYHIDKSDRNAGYSERYDMDISAALRWDSYNEVNCRPSHQCADLIEPSNYTTSTRGVFFPTSTVNSLTPDGSPSLSYWSGAKSKISITNIRKRDDEITFNILGFSDTKLPPDVKSHFIDRFMDAAIIQFESDREHEGEATVEWGRNGKFETVKIKPYEPGKYSITLDKLEPDNSTYVLKIHFESDGLIGNEYEIAVVTKKSPSVKWPHIHLTGITRNNDGTFIKGTKLPLRVYNATNAAEISWTFNGKDIKTGGDGYYAVNENGILKALVIWEDGSEEILMKEITLGKEEQ